jgi:hypothetical protein
MSVNAWTYEKFTTEKFIAWLDEIRSIFKADYDEDDRAYELFEEHMDGDISPFFESYFKAGIKPRDFIALLSSHIGDIDVSPIVLSQYWFSQDIDNDEIANDVLNTLTYIHRFRKLWNHLGFYFSERASQVEDYFDLASYNQKYAGKWFVLEASREYNPYVVIFRLSEDYWNDSLLQYAILARDKNGKYVLKQEIQFLQIKEPKNFGNQFFCRIFNDVYKTPDSVPPLFCLFMDGTKITNPFYDISFSKEVDPVAYYENYWEASFIHEYYHKCPGKVRKLIDYCQSLQAPFIWIGQTPSFQEILRKSSGNFSNASELPGKHTFNNGDINILYDPISNEALIVDSYNKARNELNIHDYASASLEPEFYSYPLDNLAFCWERFVYITGTSEDPYRLLAAVLWRAQYPDDYVLMEGSDEAFDQAVYVYDYLIEALNIFIGFFDDKIHLKSYDTEYAYRIYADNGDLTLTDNGWQLKDQHNENLAISLGNNPKDFVDSLYFDVNEMQCLSRFTSALGDETVFTMALSPNYFPDVNYDLPQYPSPNTDDPGTKRYNVIFGDWQGNDPSNLRKVLESQGLDDSDIEVITDIATDLQIAFDKNDVGYFNYWEVSQRSESSWEVALLTDQIIKDGDESRFVGVMKSLDKLMRSWNDKRMLDMSLDDRPFGYGYDTINETLREAFDFGGYGEDESDIDDTEDDDFDPTQTEFGQMLEKFYSGKPINLADIFAAGKLPILKDAFNHTDSAGFNVMYTIFSENRGKAASYLPLHDNYPYVITSFE